MVTYRIFDKFGCFRRGQPVLGLALKLRIANEHGQHHFTAGDDVVCGQL